MFNPVDEITKEEAAKQRAKEIIRAQQEAEIMAKFKDAAEDHEEAGDRVGELADPANQIFENLKLMNARMDSVKRKMELEN